ncbi:WYL domain-containing protein [Bacillus sp. NP157]|nr:WYL domain-containing protein [Bacillus sp. NP157]
MNDDTPSTRSRWGQDRRLEFIESRLQYARQLNRADLMDFFNISAPKASKDLADYDDLAPGNMAYDARLKRYHPTPAFRPRLIAGTAEAYLNELYAVQMHIIPADTSFFGKLPPAGLVDTPARPLDAEGVATFVDAINRRQALTITYYSMRAPQPTTRIVSPHALGFDGLRWHVRAFCHLRRSYRDFAIGRSKDIQPADEAYVDAGNDRQWNLRVPLVLAANPGLADWQRLIVEEDYKIDDTGTLELDCRRAMLFYTVRHLNLMTDDWREHPERHHVVLLNKDAVEKWIAEDALA